nr:unnamed protein product [Callosobruchus analis]
MYLNRTTITRPMAVRLHEALSDLETSLPRVYTVVPRDIPPWETAPVKVRLDCLHHKKSSTNPAILRAIFHSIVDAYPNALCIFTDGSKTDSGVGSAIHHHENDHSWTLPTQASIHTAELYAILQALNFAMEDDHREFLVCTDSLSSIQALTNVFNRDPLIISVLMALHRLDHNMEKKITFVWTPSHVEITGNEAADLAARNATQQPHADDVPVRTEDAKKWFKGKILAKWQYRYSRSQVKLLEVKDNVYPWPFNLNMKRREQVVIARLRMGHTNVTSMHLLRGESPPMCSICQEIITTKHILLDCPQYEHYRIQLNLPNNIRCCLNSAESIKNVLKFMQLTNVFTKI